MQVLVPTVLVVDDDAFMRVLIQRSLSAGGIRARTFASAAELLATNELHAPCVLLLDVSMPGMSGPELQHLLREQEIDVPIIFLTGSADIAIAVTAMRNGAIDFLEKPFDPSALVARVRQVLDAHDPEAAAKALSIAIDAAEYERRLATLTPRERAVFDLLVTGASSKAMARTLGGSFRTIEIHRGRVMEKMAAASLSDLVRASIGTSPLH